MQAGAYQNGTWVVGVAKGGIEEGVESLAQSAIIAPSGQIVAQATTIGDELISARCDLDMCDRYKETLFDFDRYRRPEMYQLIARSHPSSKGAAHVVTRLGADARRPPTSVDPIDPMAPRTPRTRHDRHAGPPPMRPPSSSR